MSIKLYNGYRMKVNNLADLQSWLNDLRDKLTYLANEHIMEEVARRAVYGYDLAVASPNRENVKKSSNYIIDAWLDVKQDFDDCQKKSTRAPAVDVECELILSFYGEYVYFVIFSEKQDFVDIITNLPGVEEYGYWDNTDKPDSISDKEWEERRATWDKIFGTKPFSKGGVSWKLIGDSGFEIPRKEMIEKFIPSFDIRVKTMVREIVLPCFPGNIEGTLSYRTLIDALEWYKNDEEALKLREEMKKKLLEIMDENLTYEKMLGQPS